MIMTISNILFDLEHTNMYLSDLLLTTLFRDTRHVDEVPPEIRVCFLQGQPTQQTPWESGLGTCRQAQGRCSGKVTCRSGGVKVGISMCCPRNVLRGTAGANAGQMDGASPRRTLATVRAPGLAMCWGHKACT